MSKQVNKTLSFLTIGLHLVSGVVVGVGIGYLLDKYFGTSPYLTIIFFFFGLAAGFKNMYVDAKKYIQSEEKNQ
jgi:ATP synthase protein I